MERVSLSVMPAHSQCFLVSLTPSVCSMSVNALLFWFPSRCLLARMGLDERPHAGTAFVGGDLASARYQRQHGTADRRAMPIYWPAAPLHMRACHIGRPADDLAGIPLSLVTVLCGGLRTGVHRQARMSI